jgi:hypothetical protein
MAGGLAPLVPFFAAFWFFLAAAYFLYSVRSLPGGLARMYPIGAYLVGIGLFFVIRGWDAYATTSCAYIDCTQTFSGIAVMGAAAFIAQFPLGAAWPRYQRQGFLGLLGFAVVSQLLVGLFAPGLHLPLAHAFAFLVAGVFTIGFMLYHALAEDSAVGMGIALSMSSCCVVGHGLAMLPLAAAVSLPLVGIPLGLPVLFAVLAPISLIAVMVFVSRMGTLPAGRSGPDASAEP